MTLEEAIQATDIINPDIVIPMHFGAVLGSSADAYRFQNLLKDRHKALVLTTD
jgi:L-ascorbate metabolism protein UlaG (beta-lactamase superfamily)